MGGPYEFGLRVRLRDLPELLSRELDPAHPRGLRVTSVDGQAGHVSDELVLFLDVEGVSSAPVLRRSDCPR